MSVNDSSPQSIPVSAVLLHKIANGLSSIAEPLGRYFGIIGAILAMVMSLGIIVDQVSTKIFNIPLPGMIETETFMLVTVGFLSLAYAMSKNSHIRVDLLLSRFPKALDTFLGIVFSLWGVFIFALMVQQSIVRAIDAIAQNEQASITTIPMAPFYFVSAAGCILIGVIIFARFFEHIADFLAPADQRNVPLLVLALAVAVAGIALPYLLYLSYPEIDKTLVGLVAILLLIGLMLLGFPVAFAMAFVGYAGLIYMMGPDVMLNIIRMNTYDSVAHYFLCVIPFFILMGLICLKSGIGARLYLAFARWFGWLPGGLAIATVFGCGGFAAICGDSMATAATMGSVSLPEMKKYGYDDSLAAGSIAAGGTLGILIPPSIGFIVYGIVTQQSIGSLFIAGILPGILLTLGFAVAIAIQCILKPEMAPSAPKSNFREKFASLVDIIPIASLFVIVIGGIYMGIVTPTEAGGVGVIGALVIASFYKDFTLKGFFETLLNTAEMTAMIFAVLIGVYLLGYFVTFTDIPSVFAAALSGLPVSRYVTFVLILLLYLFLGMVMNIIPMMLLTLPILFPAVMALGFDPIWFGVVMVVMMEMGQITPPVGLNVFVIHGVAQDISMFKIFKGILPFLVVEVIVILILTIFPDIALYLPNMMGGFKAIDF